MAEAMNIYEKLMNVQNELKAPKGQFNSFGKYKYRSCEDILEAVKPIAAKFSTVVMVSDDMVLIGERYYIKATASLYNAEDGAMVSNTAFAREEAEKKGMDGSQITGTASSYARKYALNGLLCIDDTKDADTDEHKNQQTKEETTKKAPQQTSKNEEQKAEEEAKKISQEKVKKDNVDALLMKMKKKGVEKPKICARYGVCNLEDLTLENWQSAMNKLEKAPDKEQEDLGLV